VYLLKYFILLRPEIKTISIKNKTMEVHFEGKKQVIANVNGFTIGTDQHPRGGGEGLAPEPFTLFLASLATCAGIFVKGFCDQRGISTDKIRLTQDQQFDPIKRIITLFMINIYVPQDFPEKYDKAVIQAASLCLVKRHLREDIEMDVKVIRE